MKKLVLGTMVFALVMIILAAIGDMGEMVIIRGREVTIHLGPRMFYGIDYSCCDESGVEQVEVVEKVLWHRSWWIKNSNGVYLTAVPCGHGFGGTCWDPNGYQQIPLELRRHIEYARQRATEVKQIR